MKNILRSSIFAFLLIALGSCENDIEAVATTQSGAKLLTPATGTELVLLQSKENEIATTLVWDYSDFGVETAATYTVEIAKAGTDFAAPIAAGTTTNRFLSWTVKELNGVLSANGFKPFVQSSIDIRIAAQLGTAANALKQYSNVITLKVTVYTSELPQLAIPGNHQGWKPTTAPRIASSAFGKTDYEGYVWLDGGHKFVGPDANGVYDWDKGPDYGDDGSNTGKLKVKGGDLNATTAGYYLVKADTDKLTYSETFTNWGIIGDATPGAWDNSTPMNYDATAKVLKITVDLVGGKEMKFRANNAWDINFGDDGADGKLEAGGANIKVAASGNYTIVLDFNKPREYKYSITKN
jgi:starch-binding outer membrane protein SusE/F